MRTLTPKQERIITGLIEKKHLEYSREAESMDTSRREVKQLERKMKELERIASGIGSLKLKDRRLIREALATLYKRHESADLLRLNTKEMNQRSHKMREITALANILKDGTGGKD